MTKDERMTNDKGQMTNDEIMSTSDAIGLLSADSFGSSNKSFFRNNYALTPSPSPKGRGEVLLEPLSYKHE